MQDHVSSVQRHTKYNYGCCLRIKNNKQTCKFKFPQELSTDTYLSYEKLNFKNGNVDFRSAIQGKRNQSRVGMHQCLELPSWRANFDFQLIIEHYTCVEYLAKFAFNGEKISRVVKIAFISISKRS